jgi:hypothetical protein
VGFNIEPSGVVELVIDLGEERVVDWIGFQLLSKPEVGIHLPTELTLACFSKPELWQGIDRWYLPIKPDGAVSEYLFANSFPLSRSCSQIKATLVGSQWIFVSEIEIIAEKLPEDDITTWIADFLSP